VKPVGIGGEEGDTITRVQSDGHVVVVGLDGELDEVSARVRRRQSVRRHQHVLAQRRDQRLAAHGRKLPRLQVPRQLGRRQANAGQ
jgi:hypothetical protein